MGGRAPTTVARATPAARRAPTLAARAVRTALVAAAVLAAGALAASATQIAGDPTPPPTPTAARAATTVRSGTFAQLNSHAGLAIFSAANLAPGEAATGFVVIRNAGTLGGHFTLSAVDLADTPGPRGGLLSERLALTVVDLTTPGRPMPVYAGGLADMPARALGYFKGGEARGYRFTAAFLDGGPPPSPSTGDNIYVRSSAQVRFVWDAVEAPAPPTPPQPPTPTTPRPPDRRPPRLRLSIPSVQRVLDRGYLVVRARCDEACRLGVSGTLRADRSGRVATTRPIRGVYSRRGRTTRLRVLLRAGSRHSMRRVLLRGGTVTLRLTVTARDRFGNRTVSRRTVRLRRQ